MDVCEYGEEGRERRDFNPRDRAALHCLLDSLQGIELVLQATLHVSKSSQHTTTRVTISPARERMVPYLSAVET